LDDNVVACSDIVWGKRTNDLHNTRNTMTVSTTRPIMAVWNVEYFQGLLSRFLFGCPINYSSCTWLFLVSQLPNCICIYAKMTVRIYRILQHTLWVP